MLPNKENTRAAVRRAVRRVMFTRCEISLRMRDVATEHSLFGITVGHLHVVVGVREFDNLLNE
jgi:hypothetical protein